MAEGGGEEGGEQRRASSRIRKVAVKVTATLQDANTRNRAAQARLDALENDNVAADAGEPEEGEDMEEEEGFSQPKKSVSTKRKTRQSKALERERQAVKKGTKTFNELLHEANLESLPPDVPSYLTAAVGPPKTASRRFFCSVCGFIAPYTCVRCGSRFCTIRCNTIHTDTRCLKFVA